MRIIRPFSSIVAATALVTLLGACGDTEGDEAEEPAATTAPALDDGGDTSEDPTTGDDEGPLEFTAQDIEFAQTEASASAGDVEVSLVNDGEIEHSWLVEDHEDDLRLHVEAAGDTDEGTITLDSGSYTYFCDIPGHRAAGMEGTLTVQ